MAIRFAELKGVEGQIRTARSIRDDKSGDLQTMRNVDENSGSWVHARLKSGDLVWGQLSVPQRQAWLDKFVYEPLMPTYIQTDADSYRHLSGDEDEIKLTIRLRAERVQSRAKRVATNAGFDSSMVGEIISWSTSDSVYKYGEPFIRGMIYEADNITTGGPSQPSSDSMDSPDVTVERDLPADSTEGGYRSAGGSPAPGTAPGDEVDDEEPSGVAALTGTIRTPATGFTGSGSGSGSGAGASSGRGSASDGEDDPVKGVQIAGGYTIYEDEEGRIWLGYQNPIDGFDNSLIYELMAGNVDDYFPEGMATPTQVRFDERNGVFLQEGGSPFAVDVGDERGLIAIKNTNEDPWVGAEAIWDLEVQEFPDLYTDEYAALILRSNLELWSPERFEVEVYALDQFDGLSRPEIDRRLDLARSTPEQREDMKQTSREVVEGIARRLEIEITPEMEQSIDWIATRLHLEEWDGNKVLRQLQVLAGIGDVEEPLDPTLARIADGVAINSLSLTREAMRREAEIWIGPAGASLISENLLQQYAGQIGIEGTDSFNPTAQDEWLDFLQGQRMILFQEYGDNENLRYADIVSPYLTEYERYLGRRPDESDMDFFRMVQANSLELAGQELRKIGIEEGNDFTLNRMFNDAQRVLADDVVTAQKF